MMQRPSGTGPLDEEVLQELRDLAGEESAAFATDLIGRFLKQLPDTVAHLQQSLDQGDCTQIRQHAHGLTSSAGYVGAMHVSGLSARIESAARKEDLGTVATLVEAITAEATRADEALRRWLRDTA